MGTGLRLAAAALLAAFLTESAAAHEIEFGDLLIAHPWARETLVAGQAAAVYFAVINQGADGERLIAASTPVAASAKFHRTVMEDVVARMVEVEAVDVPAGGGAILEPGGYHLMLTGLSAPLREGERIPLTLLFERAGPVEIEVVIEALGAEPAHDHMAPPVN